MDALLKNDESVEAFPPEAYSIVQHALDTFGSSAKAHHWLERPNPLLAGLSPLQILRSEPAKYELIEDELTRIDYGVVI